MSLSVGIVGLPNVGKSTLFNALLKKQQALAANYPFATIEPNVGIVPVPDDRLKRLAEVVAGGREHQGEGMMGKEQMHYTKLPPIVPATVLFTDIAGLVAGAHKGEGLGNKFLAHIREVDAICLVVRAFEDADVVKTGSAKLGEDLEVIRTELVMADMNTLEGKIRNPKSEIRKNSKMIGIQKKLDIGFDAGKMASEVLNGKELDEIRDWFLLTAKPVLYVVNVSESELVRDPATVLRQTGSRHAEDDKADLNSLSGLSRKYAMQLGVDGGNVIIISAKVEAELAQLDVVEQMEYLKELGLERSSLERLIERSFETLGLMSFLTAGEKEVRAWTIRRGGTAVEASAVIHTDFAKKFIKADVIGFDKFVEAGGWKNAREKGWVRSEGRDYVIQEGEVVEFKIGT